MKRVLLVFFLLFFLSVAAMAQSTHKVTGKVLDENGLGFPGAGVNVKGTNVGTVTDVNGVFSLNVPDNSGNIIVIRAIGYVTQEVDASAGAISVRLASSSNQLQGAVVTALAVKREKRELAYATTTLTNKDITVANNVSPLSALEGKVAGANVTSTTGGLGGSVSVVLRGDKSITGNNQAIIVVDGVIINNYDRTLNVLGSTGTGISNSFSNLTQVDFGNSGNDVNPEDIESMTVLDGPAAAALYGSIGARGAILITTKKGGSTQTGSGKNKLRVTVKSTFTESDVLKFPTFQNQFGQGGIYGQGDFPYNPNDNFSWGLPFDGQLRPWGQIINGQQEVKPYSAQPNNVKDFYNHGKTGNNYVSVSGGNDTTNYFLSINAVNNTGITPGTFYNKYSVRFNANTQLTHTIYSSINFNYINTYSKVESQGQGVGSPLINLYQQPRDIPIQELSNNNNPFVAYGTLDANGVPRYGFYGAFSQNPYFQVNNYNNYDKVDRIIGGLTLGIKPANTNLNIYDRIGIDVAADRSTYEGPPYDYQAYPGNIYSYLYSSFPHSSSGYFLQNNLNELQLNNDLIVNYTKSLTDKLSIDVLGGQNVRLTNAESLVSDLDPATNGLATTGFYSFTNAQGALQVENVQTQRRTVGIYGDFKINYDKKLYLELTARNDWSSTLIVPEQTANNFSFFYPSIGASYVFTEGWNSGLTKKVLTYGKIRASYASVGNDAPPYANNPSGYGRTTVSSSFGSIVAPFAGQPAFSIVNTLGNPTLKPEGTNDYEAGTDLSFFKDRIALSFTYYNTLTTNLITLVPTAPSSGYVAQYKNLGSISNKGEELTLRVTPIASKSGFRWDLFGTYTHNVNEVVSLENGLSQVTVGGLNGMAIVAQVGKPYGAFYATDLLRNSKGQVVVDPGTGLPELSPSAVYEGSYQPKFIASWGTDLSYKGFTFHALFTTKQGGMYFSETKSILDFVGNSEITAYNNRNPYIFPNSVVQTGPNTYAANTTKFLPYTYYTSVEPFAYGQFLVDASYIKLQEAALYYTLPSKLMDKTAFSTVQVGVYGTNLLIWTPKSNKYDDPEENSGGGVTNEQSFNFLSRPSMRSYGVSLKVTF